MKYSLPEAHPMLANANMGRASVQHHCTITWCSDLTQQRKNHRHHFRFQTPFTSFQTRFRSLWIHFREIFKMGLFKTGQNRKDISKWSLSPPIFFQNRTSGQIYDLGPLFSIFFHQKFRKWPWVFLLQLSSQSRLCPSISNIPCISLTQPVQTVHHLCSPFQISQLNSHPVTTRARD